MRLKGIDTRDSHLLPRHQAGLSWIVDNGVNDGMTGTQKIKMTTLEVAIYKKWEGSTTVVYTIV